MNRQHAEHILDAYVRMRMRESDNDASDALREVILDAMTEYRSKPSTTWPGITLTAPNRSSNWDGTPKITCAGIDPAYRTSTAEEVGE